MTTRLLNMTAAALLASGVALAGAKTSNQPAMQLLQDVERNTRRIVVHADEMNSLERNQPFPEASFSFDFSRIKDDVNQAGATLRELEAQRATLQPWEKHALDQVEPLLASVASNESKVIQFYNEHRPYLTNPEFNGYVANIYQDSDRADKILSEYLRLAKLRSEEHRLTSELR